MPLCVQTLLHITHNALVRSDVAALPEADHAATADEDGPEQRVDDHGPEPVPGAVWET